MKSLKEHEVLSRNINVEFERKLTFGERMADNLANSAGSFDASDTIAVRPLYRCSWRGIGR